MFQELQDRKLADTQARSLYPTARRPAFLLAEASAGEEAPGCGRPPAAGRERSGKMSTGTERTATNMRRAAQTLSEMLAHTVAETRRLQRLREKALGRRYASGEELKRDYDPDEMKDLTGLLKDIAAVTKALDERSAEDRGQLAAGVLVLPAAELAAPDGAGKEGCE